MNTGFLGPAVATVLTVYGIETNKSQCLCASKGDSKLQQYLPFTVLKPSADGSNLPIVLSMLQQYLPFTVLKL